jgi:hypothetical protein
MLAGIGHSLADDLLVAQVDAIKHANRQADLAAAIGQFAGSVDHFHFEISTADDRRNHDFRL